MKSTKESAKNNTISKEILDRSKKGVEKIYSFVGSTYDNREEIFNKFKLESQNAVEKLKTPTKSIGQKGKNNNQNNKQKVKGFDVFNKKIRQKSVDEFNKLVDEYEEVAKLLENNAIALHKSREQAIKLIKIIEFKINQISNTPKELNVELKKISFEIDSFEEKQKFIINATKEAKFAAAGSTTSATLSALGITVATMGPTAAMGIATTFGVASTGTAISSLSGAAATNAALAWLGGGALSAGGAGISAGSALLALAGPVGWTLAGIAFSASVGTGIFASRKNKDTALKLIDESKNLMNIKREFESKNFEIESLNEVTKTQIIGLELSNKQVVNTNYMNFSEDEKKQVGILVNSALVLSQLLNKELTLYE